MVVKVSSTRFEKCMAAHGGHFARCSLPKGHKGGHGRMSNRSPEEQERLIAECKHAEAQP